MAVPKFDVGRVGEHHIKCPAGLKRPEVGMPDFDSILQPVETHVAPGQLGKPLLDLQSYDLAERLDAQKERDDATACSELQAFILTFCPDEIGQKGSIDGEPVARFFLKDKDAAMKKSIEGLIRSLQPVYPSHPVHIL